MLKVIILFRARPTSHGQGVNTGPRKHPGIAPVSKQTFIRDLLLIGCFSLSGDKP